MIHSFNNVRFVLSCLFLLFIFFDYLYPQTEQQEIPPLSEEVSVSVVNLYASVRDGKGRPVYGLKKEDFSLFINGKQQQISHFSADVTEPLNIIFLLDVSGSMRLLDKFETAKDIIRAVIAKLDSDDEVALMIFADGQVEMLVEFTKDKNAVIKRMDQLKPYGGTALRDAIAYCHRLLIDNVGKKGVLLFSDGLDNRSDLSLNQAVRIAGSIEIPIYTFELVRSEFNKEEKEADIDILPLKVFAEATGGLYFSFDEGSPKDIDKACAKIFDDLKYQYYIGYMPSGSPSYGKVQLKTRDSKQKIRVRYSVVPESSQG